MKKLSLIYLVAIFIIIFLYSFNVSDYHKVLKIINANEFYVDFNNNNVADVNELVVLEAFAYRPLSFSKEDNLCLKYFGIQYAKTHLLNKFVKVIKDNEGNYQVSMLNGKFYTKMLIEDGIVPSDANRDKVITNIQQSKKLDLVAYNKTTNKYHELSCKYVYDSPFFEILKRVEVKKKASPCKICIVQYMSKNSNYPKDIEESYSPIYKDDFIEFYITDFTKYFYPSHKCLTTACKSLLNEINAAKHTIDFAIYGIDGQPEIVNALINAQNRGVKIRWVYDTDKDGRTIYKDSVNLAKILQNNRMDIDIIVPSNNSASVRDAIMHNKFFIFDNQKVWAGSANIAKTDLAGFNANSVILINSKDVANLYKEEFEKMFSGSFHRLKSQTLKSNFIVGVSNVSVFFSPQDNVIQTNVIPLVKNAQNYIYVPVFVITHKILLNSLIEASHRGVDVRLIVDSTSANGKYSVVSTLRENGIPVKVEHFAGKMHMKSMIIDDEYSIIGSMNFTKSGEKYNDENILIIKNNELAKSFKYKFLYFWNHIPNKWLHSNPISESFDSINSCFDGIDNDFDGKIDKQDEGCFLITK